VERRRNASSMHSRHLFTVISAFEINPRLAEVKYEVEYEVVSRQQLFRRRLQSQNMFVGGTTSARHLNVKAADENGGQKLVFARAKRPR
jgi:hypothetical protein